MVFIDKIRGCLQICSAQLVPQAGTDENKLQVSEHKIMCFFFSCLKEISLFIKSAKDLNLYSCFSSGKHKQKPLPLGGSIKHIFLAPNCQPSRNEIIQLVINLACKLLERAPSNIDISITGSHDARLCLQIKVILKARGRRKCLGRHPILL